MIIRIDFKVFPLISAKILHNSYISLFVLNSSKEIAKPLESSIEEPKKDHQHGYVVIP